MRFCRFNFLEKVRGLDMYGIPFSLQYNGEDKYKSLPGAFISLIVLVFCIIYGTQKALILVFR